MAQYATPSEAISVSYKDDRYNHVDGELIKAADELATLMEAYLALENGISNPQLQKAVQEKKLLNDDKMIAGIDIGKAYEDFKKFKQNRVCLNAKFDQLT